MNEIAERESIGFEKDSLSFSFEKGWSLWLSVDDLWVYLAILCINMWRGFILVEGYFY